jgi:hypothetical protein
MSTGPSAVFALLHWFRRLHTRWKVREAFLALGPEDFKSSETVVRLGGL